MALGKSQIEMHPSCRCKSDLGAECCHWIQELMDQDSRKNRETPATEEESLTLLSSLSSSFEATQLFRPSPVFLLKPMLNQAEIDLLKLQKSQLHWSVFLKVIFLLLLIFPAYLYPHFLCDTSASVFSYQEYNLFSLGIWTRREMEFYPLASCVNMSMIVLWYNCQSSVSSITLSII